MSIKQGTILSPDTLRYTFRWRLLLKHNYSQLREKNMLAHTTKACFFYSLTERD